MIKLTLMSVDKVAMRFVMGLGIFLSLTLFAMPKKSALCNILLTQVQPNSGSERKNTKTPTSQKKVPKVKDKIFSSHEPLFVLGLENSCTLDEVKKRFKKLATLYHPDIRPEDEKIEATQEFQHIGNARDNVVAWIENGKRGQPELLKEGGKGATDSSAYKESEPEYDHDIDTASWENWQRRRPGMTKDEFDNIRAGNYNYSSPAFKVKYNPVTDSYYEPYTNMTFTYDNRYREYVEPGGRYWYNPTNGHIEDPVENAQMFIDIARWMGHRINSRAAWWNGGVHNERLDRFHEVKYGTPRNAPKKEKVYKDPGKRELISGTDRRMFGLHVNQTLGIFFEPSTGKYFEYGMDEFPGMLIQIEATDFRIQQATEYYGGFEPLKD